MTPREPGWKQGLEPDLDPEEVYESFRQLLENLPMSLRDLARTIERDRTTVSRWKTGEKIASLEEQQQVFEAVEEELRSIQGRVDHAQEMASALREVEEAHRAHEASWDQETLADLKEANERVRELTG